MTYRKILYLLLLTLFTQPLLAQELAFTVTVNADRVQTTERRIFQNMQSSIEQFLNNRKWTTDEFSQQEKIKGNLVITIEQMPTLGNFSATVQVQTTRPVYNTNYESLVLNFADRNWQFEYLESQPLEFNPNNFTNNLTSLLAFYAYVAIGLDYDTFSNLGGNPHFEQAYNVVNNAQQSPRPGWKQFESNRNRYWLAENLFINQTMAPVREAIYRYHRHGLDKMSSDPAAAREEILTLLVNIEAAARTVPGAILIVSFMDAKSDELVNIFKAGTTEEKQKAYDLLSKIDPNNSNKYRSLIN
ncbi:DUF4835 family protein [Penaeicola halotolerans]|uniref:type IX secretion system protein PorD n=1 Tax=Penaeicola halotolerans TaxID=2793196 RepID=UPI001CF90F69|nr:DUF4835 family protein [Penaeicola halotolerans]